MIDEANQTRSIPTIVLFWIAGVLYVISLASPVVQVMTNSTPIPGVTALCVTTSAAMEGIWQTITNGGLERISDLLVPLMGFMANATLATSAALGYRLRQRNAMPMLWLSLNGLAVGFAMPWVMGGFSADVYSELYFGYWLWIASLALVAAGWGSIVWHQLREVRAIRE